MPKPLLEDIDAQIQRELAEADALYNNSPHLQALVQEVLAKLNQRPAPGPNWAEQLAIQITQWDD